MPVKGLTLRQPWAINREKFSKSPLGVTSLEIIDLTICYSEVDFTNITSSNSLFSFIRLLLCRYPETHPFHIHDQILWTFTHKSPLGPKRVARFYRHCMRCVCVHMCAKSLQSCPAVCNSLWTVACQAPLSMGFSRQERWSVSPCPPPGHLPHPGIKPKSLYLLH